MRNKLTFINKKNRDARAIELKKKGFIVKKLSVRNQQLHPEYIEDWKKGFKTGVGNTDYQTFHKVLYILTWEYPEEPEVCMTDQQIWEERHGHYYDDG